MRASPPSLLPSSYHVCTLDDAASSVVATPANAFEGAGGALTALLLLPKKECNVKACVGGDRTRRRPRRGRRKLLLVVVFIFGPCGFGMKERGRRVS